MTPSKLRAKVRRLYEEYRAIQIFSFRAGKLERSALDGSLDAIRTATRLELTRVLAELGPQLDELRRELGVRDGHRLHQFIAKDALEAPGHGNMSFIRIPKVAEHLTKFPPIQAMARTFAPHACVSIDTHGVRDDPPPEIFLLEGSLFEDMAMLWNEVKDAEDYPQDKTKLPFPEKRIGALQRATIRAAFAMLEGYLNGLGSDIVQTNGHRLSDSEVVKLTEWDEKRQQTKTLSLRDKILQYPKIANRSNHPPLTETNCNEVRIALELEQQFRHAFIHPTPQWDYKDTSKMDRESTYHQLRTEDVALVCDTLTSLIRKIDEAVEPDLGDLSEWLFDRDSSDRYPARAFS